MKNTFNVGEYYWVNWKDREDDEFNLVELGRIVETVNGEFVNPDTNIVALIIKDTVVGDRKTGRTCAYIRRLTKATNDEVLIYKLSN